MNPEEELHSFSFCEKVAGAEHAYRITEMADNLFGVERDGTTIAELTNNGEWTQTDGEPLSKKLIEKIGNKIEAHYD